MTTPSPHPLTCGMIRSSLTYIRFSTLHALVGQKGEREVRRRGEIGGKERKIERWEGERGREVRRRGEREVRKNSTC